MNLQLKIKTLRFFLQNFDSERNHNISTSTFEELDAPITIEEIERCVKKLSRNKSPGLDELLNEYFIEAIGILSKPLEILFNVVLNSGFCPSGWTKGIIIPLHKKVKLTT